MAWLFTKAKTPADLLRENKRTLDKAIRELDRERNSLQQQEKKLVGEIKQMAKQNQMSAVRVMAKDLIRTRHSITKFYSLKSQLQGVSLRMQTLKSTQAMADAMRCGNKLGSSCDTESPQLVVCVCLTSSHASRNDPQRRHACDGWHEQAAQPASAPAHHA